MHQFQEINSKKNKSIPIPILKSAILNQSINQLIGIYIDLDASFHSTDKYYC